MNTLSRQEYVVMQARVKLEEEIAREEQRPGS